MKTQRLLLFALIFGALVVVLPWLLPTGPNTSRFASSGSFWVDAAIVFGGGLLTALTPCVYPLIPITVSIFGAKKDQSRGKAFALTSSYVVGMGVIFAGLGVLAAKTGQAFGSMLGNPFVVGAIALLLLLLAASMFGAFELQLPDSVAQRLNRVGGTGFAGAFLMGSVSGFIAAPCTGPVLSGLLAYVAKSADVKLGASLLFIYALGIGVPFFLIGVFALKLPKSGAWMEGVKSVLGILLVWIAVGMIRDAWPFLRETASQVAFAVGQNPGAILAGVMAAVGVLLGAVHLSFKSHKREVAMKAVGVLLVVGALLLRTGALQAVKFEWAHKFNPATDETSLQAFEKVLADAKAENRPVMIDFFAEWCAACKELDRETYPSEQIAPELARFISVKVDGTNEVDALQTLYERFGVQGLPTVAFVASNGEILKEPKVTGFMLPEEFDLELKKVP